MFAQNLKKLREENGFTQEELASKVGISRNTLFGYENGVKIPNVMTASALAKELGVAIDELVK